MDFTKYNVRLLYLKSLKIKMLTFCMRQQKVPKTIPIIFSCDTVEINFIYDFINIPNQLYPLTHWLGIGPMDSFKFIIRITIFHPGLHLDQHICQANISLARNQRQTLNLRNKHTQNKRSNLL